MKKINLNTLWSFEIPPQKVRIYILAFLAIVIAMWCLVLPPMSVESISVEVDQSKNIAVNSAVQETSAMPQTGKMFNYWNIPLIKHEKVIKPKVTTDKIIPKKVDQIVLSQEINPIPIQVALPPVQYMGQVMDKEKRVNVFIKVGEENIILTPNVPHNNTWVILENSPYQIIVQHIPDQQTITVSK
ncbi:hypothetical protein MMO39_12620 [Acinetobacter modestus]|uniref:hypothetical protein n=1 Tax=Acinetobacter modestus TaxID=1776740 RepID=UPI001F4B11AA|nr:hypothetical protein [Acinetobacter modestus]MCH7388136.1 hypothetical protein [Acinetobacter modestus]